MNPWNRNFLPRWFLRAGGVSGQLKAVTGPEPWEELAGHGMLRLGQAVVTSAGDLECAHAIIHVAGFSVLWRASTESVALSVRSAVRAAVEHRFETITMPLIGAGTGRLSADASRRQICTTIASLPALEGEARLEVKLVERASV